MMTAKIKSQLGVSLATLRASPGTHTTQTHQVAGAAAVGADLPRAPPALLVWKQKLKW